MFVFIKNLIIYRTIKYCLLKLYFIPNEDGNVLSASISFSCVFGSNFIFEKSNDWPGAQNVSLKFLRQFSWKCMYIGPNFAFSFPVNLPVWNVARDFITFFSFLRLCMKFNTFFAFIKLYFSKIILTLYDVVNIRLLRIINKTLSRLSFKSTCVLQRVYLD